MTPAVGVVWFEVGAVATPFIRGSEVFATPFSSFPLGTDGGLSDVTPEGGVDASFNANRFEMTAGAE